MEIDSFWVALKLQDDEPIDFGAQDVLNFNDWKLVKYESFKLYFFFPLLD